MTKLYKLLLPILFVAISFIGYAQQVKTTDAPKTNMPPMALPQLKLSKEVTKAMDMVDSNQIRADVTYLADDKLLGRAPGTPGYQMAVDYVTQRLKSLGVKPAGENGTWVQTVKFRKSFSSDGLMAIDGGAELKKGTDYTISSNPSKASVNAKAGLVFVGYGASEPKLGYDDYAGVDVKGKIVVVVSGAPDKFSSSVSAHTRNRTQIMKAASEHGAIGVLVASVDTGGAARGGRGGGGGAPRGVNNIVDETGKTVVSSVQYGNIDINGTLGAQIFNTLAQKAGKNIKTILPQLKAGTPNSFDLNTTVNVSYTSTYQDMISYNVVGTIEGTDPKLKKEYVVHSAHLDHLGVGRPVQGDSIYNGAHDNAVGTASVLAIANIYKNIKVKPKRSIIFILMTGEELGDMGSSYFAKHPTVPPGSMVADVNTDMPTIIAPLLSVTALGAEHSSLATQVAQAAGYLGLGVEDDPEPAQARFTRSDQYSFVVNGIPALHIKYGAKTADGKNNLNDFVAVWRAKYYHKPQDDINGIFDFRAGKTYAELNFLIGYLVAQDPNRPTWNKGDIFETN
jgi:Zn-dependent M28 family amino/carboxypeptidase